ncbi:hypothetical protein [Agilicoccus flavus]|uniref:hypothetical protein n=1 Tax=Agilicoccus flavus TaxID=2775968 RepID=UPI001CF60BAD|nr:hypothetical protein [Agilicoccus flavus]
MPGLRRRLDGPSRAPFLTTCVAAGLGGIWVSTDLWWVRIAAALDGLVLVVVMLSRRRPARPWV